MPKWGLDMAEVDPDDRLERLVLVEDKLLRNPEARRKVVAQILEYRQKVQVGDRVGDRREPAGGVVATPE
jgi:hypothetical protein